MLSFLLVALAGAWEFVGLPGTRVLSIGNPDRDYCYAASESVLYRGDRYGNHEVVYRYGSHPDLRVCVRADSRFTDERVCLAWGWGSRSDGAWMSTDCGYTWQLGTYLLYAGALDAAWDHSFGSLALVGSDTLDNPPLRSTDSGASWTPCSSGLPTNQVRCFAIREDDARSVLCGTREHGLYLSSDSGASWRYAGPDSTADVRSADWCGEWLLALADLHDTTAVWCSRDTGRTWVRELVLPGGTEVAGNRATQAGGCGVYVGPGSWEPEGIGCSVVRCISTVGSAYWYAGTDSGVFHLDLTPGVKGEPESRPTTGGRPALLSSGLSGLSRPGLDVLFDPAGRRVTASRSGIYFARPASGVMRDVSSVYKVILVP